MIAPSASGRILTAPFDDIIVDLKGCNLLELSVGLTEYDKPAHRYDTWPQAIRTIIERECTAWLERNPNTEIVAITTAVVPGACVFCVHWRMRK